MKPYELIDHTADVGLRAFGKTLPELFRNAAIGLFEMMTDLEKVSHKVKRDIHLEEKNVEEFEMKKANQLEIIRVIKIDLEQLKIQRKATKKHIALSELPADKQFRQLSTHSKHLIDTIKMIAYRAETAMATIVREKTKRTDDTRSLLRSIYNQTIDLLPLPEKKELHVKLHHAANQMSDDIIRLLCSELNETKTTFPGTDLRLVYSLVSD